MALYTRMGDKGFTLLPGPDGAGPLRVRKDDARLTALGEVDELNALIGLCAVEAARAEHVVIRKTLTIVQKELLRMGAALLCSASARNGRRSLTGFWSRRWIPSLKKNRHPKNSV